MKKICLIFLAVLTLCGCQRTEIKEPEIKKPELLSLRDIESLHDAYYEGICPNKTYVEAEADVEKYKTYGYLNLHVHLGYYTAWNRNQVSEDEIQMQVMCSCAMLEDIKEHTVYFDDEITIVDFFDYFIDDDAKVDQLIDAEEHAVLRKLTYEFICDEFVPLLK